MKTNFLKPLIAAVSFSTLAIFILLQLKVVPDLTSVNVTTPSSALTKPNHKHLRELAEQPFIRTEHVASPSNTGVETLNAPSDLSSACKLVAVTIAKVHFSDFVKDLETNLESQKCAMSLGMKETCFSESDELCEQSALIVRAKIIDALTANVDPATLDVGVLSNRLFASFNSEVQDPKKIFETADSLLTKDFQNPEAHNLRSYYAIETFKQNGDVSVLGKLSESAEFLENSERDTDQQRALLYKYASKLLKYSVEKDAGTLAESENVANQYMTKFPNDPDGYYLAMQAAGYKGDKEAAIKWLNKGLSFGINQANYAEYQTVKHKIETDGLKTEYLGLRISPKKQFRTQDLLKAE